MAQLLQGFEGEANVRYRPLIGHSGTAAHRRETAPRAQGIDLLVNRNFSTSAICKAVMDNRDIIERTALELIKLHPQLGCWPTCGLRVGGSRWDDDAAGDKGTATRSVVEITGRQLGSIALGAGAADGIVADMLVALCRSGGGLVLTSSPLLPSWIHPRWAEARVCKGSHS